MRHTFSITLNICNDDLLVENSIQPLPIGHDIYEYGTNDEANVNVNLITDSDHKLVGSTVVYTTTFVVTLTDTHCRYKTMENSLPSIRKIHYQFIHHYLQGFT